MKAYYGITYWNIPFKSLCPPVPGRADYIHYVSDLQNEDGIFLRDKKCRCIDIGVGANCIYPIIGCAEYKWNFVGTDIDELSLKNARKIVTCNPVLSHHVELRLQSDSRSKLVGVIQSDEYFDLLVCNPPFYKSAEHAQRETLQKLSNLKNKPVKNAVLNFGGFSNELWTIGGEFAFISSLIEESKTFSRNVGWFTSLVSKKDDLAELTQILKSVGVSNHKIIEMSQGSKISRILAWHF